MKMLFNSPVNAITATAIRLLAENRRTTEAASSIASLWFDFNTRRKNAARGARAPGQNAEVRRWSASPKRWTTPSGPGLAAAWPTHARETSSITESPTRVVCEKLRLPDVRATIRQKRCQNATASVPVWHVDRFSAKRQLPKCPAACKPFRDCGPSFRF